MWRIALLTCCALTGPAFAQGTSVPDNDQRYVFHEVDEGILRLDTKLGEISLCTRQSVGWTCRTVPDERNALDAELARLQQENAELKNALAAQNERNPARDGSVARGDTAPGEPKAEPKAGQSAKAPEPAKSAEPTVEPKAESKAEPKAEPKIEPKAKPSGGDLERVRVVVSTIWRRLVEMMANLRADLDKEG
jgi:hypothetical protein